METNLFTRLINHNVSNEFTRSEDYLTEVFGYLLINDRKFFDFVMKEFFEITNPLFTFDNATIKTQETLTKESRFDMEFTFAKDGKLLGKLIIENKIDASFEPNQLERYFKAIENVENGYLMVINGKKNHLVYTLHETDKFLGEKHWEDLFDLLKGNSPFKDNYLVQCLLELLSNLGLDDYAKKLKWQDWECGKLPCEDNEKILEKVCDVLEVLPDTKLNQILQGTQCKTSSDNMFVNDRRGYGGGKGKPQPIKYHKLRLSPACDIIYPNFLCPSIMTLFQRAKEFTEIKTSPDERPVVCLQYSFWQTKLKKEGKDNCKKILKRLDAPFTETKWNEMRLISEEYRENINAVFEAISKDSSFKNIALIKGQKVVGFHNSLTLPIAYTDDVVSENSTSAKLTKYYMNLVAEIVPILDKYNVYQMANQFYADLFLCLMKK